jgi:GH24 family phage-related lysozyme (muramidase)
LDAERKALVSALTRLFEARDLSALEQRLDRWLKRKGGTVPTCKVTPKTRARAAMEARR